MRQIYLQAERVITYISPATEFTVDAIRLAVVLLQYCIDSSLKALALLTARRKSRALLSTAFYLRGLTQPG